MQDWVVDVVRQLGPLGVALLMFWENLFPPLPSEVIMPLAGYLSARGQAPFWVMVAAGSVGSLAGAAVWYGVGRAVTHDRLLRWVRAHGTWLAMTPADVDRATNWFARHGRGSVFFGRLVPVVRTLISVPAGFTRMPAAPFLALSALGTVLWTFVLAYLAYGRISVGAFLWNVVRVTYTTYPWCDACGESGISSQATRFSGYLARTR